MITVNQTVSAVRAIASEFARRIFKPVAIIFGVVAVVVLGLVVWLCTVSLWWLLLAIPVAAAILIAVVLLVISGIVIRIIAPRQTKVQRTKVVSLVDKIQRLSEVTQTPKALLLARAVRDIVAPTKEGFVRSIVADTSSLKTDFNDVIQSFSE